MDWSEISYRSITTMTRILKMNESVSMLFGFVLCFLIDK